MNEQQEKLLKNLHVEAHVARSLGLNAGGFYAKLNALNAGKNPILKAGVENARSFETAYKTAQIKFWNDLSAIATEKLKELAVVNAQ